MELLSLGSNVLRIESQGSAQLESSHQCVLVDLPILHDDQEILGRIGKEIDVLQWVAINEQKIRERADLHYAELASIGTALARQRQQIGVGRCRHDQRFSGRIPTNKGSQDRTLFLRESTREQDVGTPRCLDFVFLREGICFSYPRENFVSFFSL